MSKPTAKFAACYVRVSNETQKHASQMPDMSRWAEGQPLQVRWYVEKHTGRTQERKAWMKLEADMRAGKIAKLVCHRIDRLGRTARELLQLFSELRQRKIDLVVVTSGIMGLDTPEGRLMAGIIAQFAEFDNEVRSSRILEGQAAARKAGKRWGGSKAGVRKKVTDVQAAAIKDLRAKGFGVSAISRAMGLNRGTTYSVLAE